MLQDGDSGGAWPTFLLISVMACFPDETEQEQRMKATTVGAELSNQRQRFKVIRRCKAFRNPS